MAEASQTLTSNARGLPVELYETIFQQVSKSDLCSLARCSSTFQIVAESFIYHSLNSTHYLNFIKAAHYVLSCPRRHRLVRVLDLTPPIQRCNCFYNSATARLTARLLTVTSHLQAFKIHGFRPRWILSRCNHPLLTTLSIIIPNPRGRRGDNREIRIHNFRYLERHPQITKLMLWLRNGFSIEGWDPSYLFPNVETLYFTGRELHHLVKNRHLKAVYLAKDDTYNMKHTEEAILYLSGMGSTLLALDLSETRFIQETRWTSQLMHLLRNLPLLRYLGLPLFGPQTEKEDDFLRSCPKTLLICRLHYNALPPTLPQVTLRLFAALESLKWIIITSADDDLTHDTNKDINTGVFTREFPSGGYTDKSELRSVFRDLGIGLEPWDDKLMNFGEFLR